MVILEHPYTSPELAAYLADSRTPVLDNAAARELPDAGRLNLLPDAEFADRLNRGARLYTTSENALPWVRAHAADASLLRGVDGMKDKARMRRALAGMYPDYFFREVGADDLAAIDPDRLPLPVVLKPAVGFFSVGVHAVDTAGAWRAAVADILARRAEWRRDYPDAVVGDDRFIIEEYISGEEYAVDAYYDGAGKPVILNILKHDFASRADVGDRLYHTSRNMVLERLDRFAAYLEKVNAVLELRDFPLHLELRVSGDAVAPIEFNPLRFAGWCTTDISLYAHGFRTYEKYLEGGAPDRSLFEHSRHKPDDIVSLIILDKPKTLPPGRTLDFDAVASVFTEVLHRRPVASPDSPVFGFLFTRTPADRRGELDRIMRSDLSEFLVDA